MQPSSNTNNFFGIKVSQPGINVGQANDKQLILSDDYSSRIYFDANGNPSVLLGTRVANASNGIKNNQLGFFVSSPGVDVTQATDFQLSFSSNSINMNIVASGTATITGPTINATSTNTWYSAVTGTGFILPADPNGNVLAGGKPYGLFAFLNGDPNLDALSFPIPGPGATYGSTFGFSSDESHISSFFAIAGSELILDFQYKATVYSGPNTGTQNYLGGTISYYITLPGLLTL